MTSFEISRISVFIQEKEIWYFVTKEYYEEKKKCHINLLSCRSLRICTGINVPYRIYIYICISGVFITPPGSARRDAITIITPRNPVCIRRRASAPLLVLRRLGGASLAVTGGRAVGGRGGARAHRPNQDRPTGHPPFVTRSFRVKSVCASSTTPCNANVAVATASRRRRCTVFVTAAPPP